MVSGNHFNKTGGSRFDEAKAFQSMLEGKDIYAVPGSTEGAGEVEIEVKGEKLRFFLTHQPSGWRPKDVVYRLMEHTGRKIKRYHIAVSGHYHTPGVGYADNTIFVTSPALQQPNTYLDIIGVSETPRGAILVEIEKINDAHRAKFYFLVEPWIERKYQELLAEGKTRMGELLKE